MVRYWGVSGRIGYVLAKPPDATVIDQSLPSRDLPLHPIAGNSPRTQQVASQIFWEISVFGV